jgi:hypothetical protein
MDTHAVVLALVTAAATATSTTALRKIAPLEYLPDAVEPPCVFPVAIELTYDLTMCRGTDQLLVTLRLLSSRTEDREAQRQAHGYLAGSGPSSVKAALEAARGAPGQLALGGAADDFRVESARGPAWYAVGANTYAGVEFIVRVIGSGSG